MFRKGPIPAWAHGLLEYAAAVLFIVAPFLFSFDDNGAKAVSIAAGVVVLLFAGFSEFSTGLSKSIPIAAHALLDYLLAILFVAMPFLVGFDDETAPTVFFIAMGVFWLLLSIATRYAPEGLRQPREPRPAERERRRFRRGEDLTDVPEFEVPPREPEQRR
ncbi:MAG TPA: hypothetical protein VF752_11890 [Thermoleophilaceae bacterium]